MEPPCKICTRLTSPTAFNSRTLGNRYKSPVTRRREYCEPRRCNAKVGTDLRSELDSRFYDVDRVDNIQRSRRNAQDLDGSQRDKREIRREDMLSNDRMNDLKNVHDAVENCLYEMEKIKTFLENENSWWKLLKARSIDCCQQKLPHLHGILRGSSVTLLLLEEEIDQLPRHFVITRSEKGNDVPNSNFRTSSRELKNEQYTDPWKERTEKYSDTYTVPHYSLDIKSTLIKVASIDEAESTQQYTKRAVTSKQSTVASECWMEAQEDRSDEEKTADRSPRSKEIRNEMQFQDKKERIDRSNIVPSKEIWYGQSTQTMFEDKLKPREKFSSEIIDSKKLAVTTDFESNQNLNAEPSSRNMTNRKPRTKTIIEKGVNQIQKFSTKISKPKIRN